MSGQSSGFPCFGSQVYPRTHENLLFHGQLSPEALVAVFRRGEYCSAVCSTICDMSVADRVP